jgi:inosine-uridine nucleoside N-ribohydrolase
MTRLLAACVALLLTFAPASAQKLIIEDNDFYGPGGSNIQSILPLLAAPGVEVLGFTVVTGDGWLDEETAALLKALEVGGFEKIPVAKGALLPLVNTPARMALWEAQFGKIPWKGAWNGPDMGPGFHADDPFLVPDMPEGAPHATPADETAAAFLIRQVRAHPHEVTILAAGPMTNLALAQRLDPEFASLARELVFMGGLVDTNMMQVTGNADFASDFNMLFDPEAAHIVLTAPWPRITVVGNVSNDNLMTIELADRFAASGGALGAYLARHAVVGLALWDELAAAVAVDPSVVTGQVEAYMDVDFEIGMNYGRVHVWPEALRPHLDERLVRIVTSVDQARFVEALVRDAGAGSR